MPHTPVYDCTRCGACCQCFPIFASKGDGDREPLIEIETRTVEPHLRTESRRFKLFPLPFLERCPFLKDDLLCRVYESRPEVCRSFEAGSLQCIEARKRIGIKDT